MMLPVWPLVMLVNVKAPPADNVDLKLLVAFMSNDRSLSVVMVARTALANSALPVLSIVNRVTLAVASKRGMAALVPNVVSVEVAKA